MTALADQLQRRVPWRRRDGRQRHVGSGEGDRGPCREGTLRILSVVTLLSCRLSRGWRPELQLLGSTELLLGGGRRDAHDAGDAAHPA